MEAISEKSRPVNNAIYDSYGDRWYTAFDDPVALLRAESRAKLPWILKKIRENCEGPFGPVLDVGCGAGFLSNPLAMRGFQVTGVDISVESLAVAQRHDATASVRYVASDAYSLPFADESFEIVTAMDFLEHVEHPKQVINEISRVLRPGGLFFYHTFNRNPVSHFAVIKLVEWFVRNTPKDMHVIRLFLKPKEVETFCLQAGMKVKEVVGLKPVFSSIPLKNYLSGVVPGSLKFKIIKSTLLSYLGFAVKESPSRR